MRLATACILVSALLLAGCGSSHPKSAAPSATAEQKAFQGSPPQLAAVHKQGSDLLQGGTSAFDQRIAQLKGHPVVVTKWASWCGPCRQEFPVFQKVSVQFGKRVAFLGVDSQDNDGDAKTFLKQYPLSYPSYADPHTKIAASMNAVGAWPTTVIYDSRGKIVNTHIGPYTSPPALVADIKKYAQ
jgi:cytochrome c biogenesis protein CcmG, thiol:disulfide interchange protein DsbE